MVESESEVTIAQDVPQEEMIAKSRVNDIVKREKAAAADKARREMEAMHAQELERLKASQALNVGSSPIESDAQLEEKINKIFNDKVRAYQQEEEKRVQEEQQAKLKAGLEESFNHYMLKVEHGKSDFPDFNDVMKDFDLQAFPGVALLAGQMDNTAAIMYELAQNPMKVAHLHVLAQQSPEMAKKELQRLSQSISKNQQAVADNVQTNAPLSRLKSSTVAGADTGQMGLKDFKNADWLRV